MHLMLQSISFAIDFSDSITSELRVPVAQLNTITIESWNRNNAMKFGMSIWMNQVVISHEIEWLLGIFQ